MSYRTSDRQAREGSEGQELKLHLDREVEWSCWSLIVS